VAKVGTSKAGGIISQQAAVHPWLAADAHGNKRTKRKISPGRCQTVCAAQGVSVWAVHVAASAGWCGHGNELPAHDNAGNVRTNAETRTLKDLNVKWLSYLIITS
jgi:hypothetical protein